MSAPPSSCEAAVPLRRSPMGDAPSGNRYWVVVDPTADNNAHAYAFELVGQGKRVLELGPAAGRVTRVLVEHGCEVVAIDHDAEAAAALEGIAECLVGDLSDPAVVSKAAEDRAVRRRARRRRARTPSRPHRRPPGLRRCSHPAGTWSCRCQTWRTPTSPSPCSTVGSGTPTPACSTARTCGSSRGVIESLLERTGFELIDLRRVLRPVFETELELDSTRFAPEVIDHVLANPEAETYQFVVRAIPHSADAEVARLARRCLDTEEALRQERMARISAEAAVSDLRTRIDDLERREPIARRRSICSGTRSRRSICSGTRSRRGTPPRGDLLDPDHAHARALPGRVRRSPSMVSPTYPEVQWIGEDRLRVGGVEMLVTDDSDVYRTTTSDDERFLLVKDPRNLERALDRYRRLAPTNVVELGVYQGGSAVFWNLTLRPARHLALDRSPLRIAPLDAFVEGDRHHGDLRLALGVDQSDVAAVTAMVDDMFGDEGSIW